MEWDFTIPEDEANEGQDGVSVKVEAGIETIATPISDPSKVKTELSSKAAPVETYKLYAMLSTIHFNSSRLAKIAEEKSGRRNLYIQRKYYMRRMEFKTPTEHVWRQK